MKKEMLYFLLGGVILVLTGIFLYGKMNSKEQTRPISVGQKKLVVEKKVIDQRLTADVFKGHPWGAKRSEIEKLRSILIDTRKHPGIQFFRKADDDLMVLGYQFHALYYGFNDADRLVLVKGYAKGEGVYDTVQEKLLGAFEDLDFEHRYDGHVRWSEGRSPKFFVHMRETPSETIVRKISGPDVLVEISYLGSGVH